MSIVVTKCSPEVVGLSEPTGTDIHLSWFDKAAGSVAMSSLLVFDKPIVDPVETIRRALSQALVHYYPIAGRLLAGGDGREVITCTGECQGVLFVRSSASGSVDDALLSSSPAPALLKDLLVQEDCCGHGDPLLLMQVTEFSGGGFVVGVTWNHVLADGAGIAQFLQAVGEFARGLPLPSTIPVRLDESVLAAQPQGMTGKDFCSAEHTMDMPFLDFTIPSSFISRVKALCACTVFEAVVALVWHCRARIVISDPESPVTLGFSGNVRGLVGATGGYYGNCAVMESVAATSGEVANSDIKDVVKLVKTAKQKIQDSLSKQSGAVPVRHRPGYNTLMVSSWRNLGLEAPDFGGGRPARVLWYMPIVVLPFLLLCPPCKGKDDGVNVLGHMVKKEQVDAFMHEIIAAIDRVNLDDTAC